MFVKELIKVSKNSFFTSMMLVSVMPVIVIISESRKFNIEILSLPFALILAVFFTAIDEVSHKRKELISLREEESNEKIKKIINNR